MVESNINDFVKVQLTEEGIVHLNKYWDEQVRGIIAGVYPAFKEEAWKDYTGFADKKKVIPADGWKSFQIWELMQIFGGPGIMFGGYFRDNALRFVTEADALAA